MLAIYTIIRLTRHYLKVSENLNLNRKKYTVYPINCRNDIQKNGRILEQLVEKQDYLTLLN